MPVAVAISAFFLMLAVAAWSSASEQAQIGAACAAAGNEWVSSWRGYECRIPSKDGGAG